MNFLTLLGAILTFVYGASAICKSTNPDGALCLKEDEMVWWMSNYNKGVICFDNRGSNVRSYLHIMLYI